MNTELIERYKRDIASEPLTPERLVELARVGVEHQMSLANQLREIFDESAAINELAKPLVKLWQLTNTGEKANMEPTIVTLDSTTADLELSSGSRHLSGNLKEIAMSAAYIEATNAHGANPSATGVVHIDAVYDRLVTLVENMIRETGHNTTAAEVIGKWKHPKSAIASVLFHSKDWKRLRKGEYEYL
jgi:hypothetical protein